MQVLAADIFWGFCEAEASLNVDNYPSVTYLLLAYWGLCHKNVTSAALRYTPPLHPDLMCVSWLRKPVPTPGSQANSRQFPLFGHITCFFIFFERSKEWSDSIYDYSRLHPHFLFEMPLPPGTQFSQMQEAYSASLILFHYCFIPANKIPCLLTTVFLCIQESV